MERPSFVCTMPQPAELNEFTAIFFFTRPSLKCLPGWLNFITLWGLLGYCLRRKIVLMALSALLIAKCFVCISYSWHCSWWVLQGPWGDLEENLQNMGTSKAPEKRNSAFLIRGIKVPLWSNSFSFVEAGLKLSSSATAHWGGCENIAVHLDQFLNSCFRSPWVPWPHHPLCWDPHMPPWSRK